MTGVVFMETTSLRVNSFLQSDSVMNQDLKNTWILLKHLHVSSELAGSIPCASSWWAAILLCTGPGCSHTKGSARDWPGAQQQGLLRGMRGEPGSGRWNMICICQDRDWAVTLLSRRICSLIISGCCGQNPCEALQQCRISFLPCDLSYLSAIGSR